MSDLNPYQAPKADLGSAIGEAEAALLLSDASAGARFLNFIIDLIA